MAAVRVFQSFLAPQIAWAAAPCGFRAQLLRRRPGQLISLRREHIPFLVHFALGTIMFRHNLVPHQSLICGVIGIIRRP